MSRKNSTNMKILVRSKPWVKRYEKHSLLLSNLSVKSQNKNIQCAKAFEEWSYQLYLPKNVRTDIELSFPNTVADHLIILCLLHHQELRLSTN